MSNFFTDLLNELKLKATYEPASSPDLVYIFIENSDGIELSRFQFNRENLFKNVLSNEQVGRIKTLFYNNIWPNKGTMLNSEDLIDFIDINYPENAAQKKQERVLSYLRSKTLYDGEKISISIDQYSSSQLWRNAYVKNNVEFFFYLDSLIESGYISCQARVDGAYSGVSLTVSGLNKAISLEEKNNSKTCFVAMSFDDEMFGIYESGIKPAIKETGFEPLIISEKKDIPSDTTINDAILAAIKKSKFTIADFTNHKHGVYFESGYALGRGQKVIYTCRQDEIEKAHFDTRNYPHIVWKDAEDLKKQLIDKIEVFIKS